MIVDTHVHFNDDAYIDNLEEVIKESVDNDCSSFFVMGTDYSSSVKAIDISRRYHNKEINGTIINCYAFVGIYPGEILKNEFSDDVSKLKWVDDLYLNNKDIVKGIGEIGIDLYWDKSQKEEQIKFFKEQLDKSIKYNLPVSIHAREATQVTYDILKEYQGKVKGVLHCYSGSVEMAKEFVKLGLKLGIGGVLTYKNSKLFEVIEALDISSFVTETDGPYLSPVPYRGQINKPAYITKVIEKIAEVKGLTYDETVKVLENNAKEVFDF